MQIEQWEDKNLSHFSYAVLDELSSEIVLIDPARNPEPYYDFAAKNNAVIVGVIETHPHADFISSHAEISKMTGAIVYASALVGAEYEHTSFDDGNVIKLEKISFKALNTPGHSPDSISVVLLNNGKEEVVFTGDTLFIGDCGRPDLREGAGRITATRDSLARQMYHSLRNKLISLPEHVIVYPAHGAGSLCGKALSKAESSTIGAEKLTNWSLQEATEDEFVKNILQDQPVVPAYFPFDVELNRQGAPSYKEGINAIKILQPVGNAEQARALDKNVPVIDTRNEKLYKKGHLGNSINLMNGLKFETWLGSIIRPGEKFYLAAGSSEELETLLPRIAAIGYEAQVAGAFTINFGDLSSSHFDEEQFKSTPGAYTIIDIRNPGEVKDHRIFASSLSIPLGELRDRVGEIPLGKPILVHCAGGYRSAAGSSIIDSVLGKDSKVLDFSDAIESYNI